MPANKTAANLGRSPKKIHGLSLRYCTRFTLLLTQFSLSSSPSSPSQLLQVHLHGVRQHYPKMRLVFRKKTPFTKISLRISRRLHVCSAWVLLWCSWRESQWSMLAPAGIAPGVQQILPLQTMLP